MSEFLEKAFDSINSEAQSRFNAAGNGQTLKEWFGVEQLKEYLKYCILVEARDGGNKLAGVILVGKQNPLTWPDGNKAEIFVLAVDSSLRKLGIGSTLVERAEKAAKGINARKIILNTHVQQMENQKFYEKLGYVKMGILKDYYDNGDAVFYSKILE